MELTDLQRLKKVVKWLIFSDFGDNEKEIAELLGYKKSSFSQIMNGKVPISDKFIDNIISIDDNINKVWIKTGQGSMFKEPSQSPASSSQQQENDNEVVALLKENNAILKDQLRDKEEKEALYKEKIKRLEREITNLEKDLQQHKKTAQPTVSDILHQPTR